LLFSTEFLAAVPLVTVFVLAEAVLLVAGVYQALLIGFDDITGFLVSTVTGQLVTIALTRWLVTDHGGMGVGIAFLAGNSIILVATATRLLREHDARQVFMPLWPLSIALVATAGAGWWAPRAGGPAIVWRAVAYLGACGVAFFFLRPDERRWLLRPWQAPAAVRPR
jgi:O-antigen/teichoic acid export membrane protein